MKKSKITICILDHTAYAVIFLINQMQFNVLQFYVFYMW